MRDSRDDDVKQADRARQTFGLSWDAVSFAVDRLCEQGLDGAERDAAAKTLTGGFRRWATSHLVRRFWPARNGIDAQAVAEDAVQHLICAVLQGKARCLRGKNADEVRRWCTRVLHNYTISELRRDRPPHAHMLAEQPVAPGFVQRLEGMDLVEKLLAALRSELLTLARRRDVASLDALMSEFVQTALLPERQIGGVTYELTP